MVKARIIAIILVATLLLAAMVPGTAAAAAPTVTNLAPYNGASNIMLRPTLKCTYNDADPNEQLAARWQISTDNAFTSLVWDTGISTDRLVECSVSRGYLQPETTYYWHVMVQDAIGYWSNWSATWTFTTAKTFNPDQPENLSPTNGVTEISPDQKLQASAFYDADGDAHFATRWQISSSAADYTSPLFDSGVDPNNKEVLSMPVGLVDYGRVFYWRVMYQDDSGLWSAWSQETSFTIVQNVPPSKPANVAPLDGTAGASLTPTLTASAFSDSDATAYVALNDSHAASQWQVTRTAGDYSNPVWDSDVTRATTSVVVPAGELEAGKTYYWHVKYQDSRDNWSGYSVETSFITKSLAAPVAWFSADKTEVVAGTQVVTFTDNSTVTGEITAWAWQFGDGATDNWTVNSRPSNGQIAHTYTTGGSMTVKLTVTNAAGTDSEVKTGYIVVHTTPAASFTVSPASAETGQRVTITDASTPEGDITSWEWQFSDGTTESWGRPERDAAGGVITHTFGKSGTHTVSLTVKGALGESFYSKEIKVTGGGGFGFGLWMIAVAVAVVAVLAGAVYIVRGRKAK